MQRLVRFTVSKLGLCLGLIGFCAFAQALELGQARLLSAQGQALRVEIPVSQLSAQDIASLQISVAPAAAWQTASLTPPVRLSSLQAQLIDHGESGARVLRLISTENFKGTVADFLLDVRTQTGVQRHQVSVLVQRDVRVNLATADTTPIKVRWGDTLSALAVSHAASGFTFYQMMAALLYTNPEAFIDGNMNLVRSGAVLQRPDRATLARLTDRQARQLFVQHMHAYAQRRARGSASPIAVNAVVTTLPDATRGKVTAETSDLTQPQEPPRDQLRLSAPTVSDASSTSGGSATVGMDTTSSHTHGAEGSQAQTASQADNRTAQQHAVQEALGRITQLETNVQALDAALQGSNNAVSNETQATASNGNGALPIGTAAQETANAIPVSAHEAQATTNTTTSTATAAPPSMSTPFSLESVTAATGLSTQRLLWLLLAIVLLVFWRIVARVLRRKRLAVNTAASGQITDAMIQEKLDTIDLNLNTDQGRPT